MRSLKSHLCFLCTFFPLNFPSKCSKTNKQLPLKLHLLTEMNATLCCNMLFTKISGWPQCNNQLKLNPVQHLKKKRNKKGKKRKLGQIFRYNKAFSIVRLYCLSKNNCTLSSTASECTQKATLTFLSSHF